MCSLVTCLQISKHYKELGDVDDFVLVNCSLTASLSCNQFPSLLFKDKLSSDLVASDLVSEIMKHPVLGKEAIWTRSENEQDTLSQVILSKKITVRSGGELNGYSHLLKHHTQAGKQTTQTACPQKGSFRFVHLYQEHVKGDP